MKQQLQQLPVHVQEKFDEEIKAELIRQQTEEELRNNPLIQSYFSVYNQQSVESFIRNYARKKAIYITKGPAYINIKEQEDLKYKMLAEEALWSIQQKKLFNLQCQWRAEQIRLKGIDHTMQFLLLSANIQHCPYLTPVSRAELDLYIKYLRSGTVGDFMWFDSWQDYESFKADYLHQQQSEDMEHEHDMLAVRIPAWYSYYDYHMGTDILLGLEDYRGAKEQKYRSLARKRQAEEIKKQNLHRTIDNRPFINAFDTGSLERFIKEFEDKKLLKYCKAVEGFNLRFDDNMEVEEALETLRSAGEAIPLNASDDWREAVIEAARQYELSQIASMLPIVFQEYHFRLENGINCEQTDFDKKKAESAFQLCELARKQILLGRLLSGEEEDFNF
jgi:hypothetical protein